MDIPEYEGLYQGSNFFKVKSLDRWIVDKGNNRKRLMKGKLLKPNKNKQTGYLYVSLCKNSVRQSFNIHRLMAELFIPNPHNYPTVDHINRIKTDNKISNLRWVPWELQADNKDKENIVKSHSKPVLQYTLDMVFVAEYPSAAEASRQTGINKSHICSCCRGLYGFKTAGGYIWKYADN